MSKMICTENDANCPSYSNKQCTFDGHCSLKEEENKMKCPTCKKELEYSGKSEGFHDIFSCKEHGYNLYIPEPKNKEKPNPSPRDIFQYIKTDCERKAFDEFMSMGFWKVPWDEPLSDKNLSEIKNHFSEWWRWLQHKGLVHKEKVKREAWVNVYMRDGEARMGDVYHKTEEEARKAVSTWCGQKHIKTILLHSWEE
jgi:hypothetical protein